MTPTQKRECYPCSLCCLYLKVPEIGKPAYIWCPQLGPKGCKIHETKHQVCKEFICEWAAGAEEIPEELRPFDINVVFLRLKGRKGETDTIFVDEVYPNHLGEDKVQEIIQAFAEYNKVIINPVFEEPYLYGEREDS